MVTYPSTHGVFEEKLKKFVRLSMINGGQVYMYRANFNALVGIAKQWIRVKAPSGWGGLFQKFFSGL